MNIFIGIFILIILYGLYNAISTNSAICHKEKLESDNLNEYIQDSL